eukprot:scaffold3255_cov191-Ochromonas_danica.AAC.12
MRTSLHYYSQSSSSSSSSSSAVNASSLLLTGGDGSDHHHGGGLRQRLPLIFHPALLKELATRILIDDPPHILFPGEKDSFLQISPIVWQCTTGYTLAIWIKIPTTTSAKGFELFRCRNPHLTIDANMSYSPDEAAFAIRIVTSSEKSGRDEVRGKILMTTDAWHLLTIKHSNPKDSVGLMTVVVDGITALENQLNYPSAMLVSSESHWTFGIGFYGLIANIAFYEVDLPLPVIKFIHGLGPYLPELKLGVSCPQSSYDSGHATLGTLVSKGFWPNRLNAIPVGFNVNAVVASAGGTMLPSRTLDSNSFYTEMIPQTIENDTNVIVSATGRCEVILTESCVENIEEAGGCNLLLYLFWAYILCKGEEEKKVDDGNDDGSVAKIQECMLHCLSLLSNLIRVHADLKEQFIQSHGFHVVAHCLSNISPEYKPILIDKKVVDGCMKLVEALGQDAIIGDGIASAFQGLLFDFRIWTTCELSTFKYFLESISSLALKAGDQLFRCIGMQKILDIFRVHISKLLSNVSPQDLHDGNNTSEQQLARDCANEIHRLMIIIKDAAIESALKVKSSEPLLEIDGLLSCLAETTSNFLAERILRLLSNIRITSPSALQKSLIYNRFYDTILVSLWMKKGFSLEVRSSGLGYLFWLLEIELKDIPQHIIQSRKNTLLSATGSFKGDSRINRGKPVTAPADSARVRALVTHLKEQARPIVRWWKVLAMLAIAMNKAMDEGIWGNLSPPCVKSLFAVKTADGSSGSGPSSSSHNISESLSNPTQDDLNLANMVQELVGSNQSSTWLMMPFLPFLLPRIDLETCQRVLMQLNIQFKTDDCHSEATAFVEESGWIEIFVVLALIGEIRSQATEIVDSKSTLTVASTCTELSLEMLSIVLEYKIKNHPLESAQCWTVLEEVFLSVCKANTVDTVLALNIERRMIRRCIALILQRLVKSSEEFWSTPTFHCVDNLLCLISERALCGVVPSFQQSTPSVTEQKGDDDILGLYDSSSCESKRVIQSTEESHMLSLLLDLMRNIRRMTSRTSFNGAEWALLKNGYLIILGCVAIVPEVLFDRVNEEIMGYLRKATESGNAPFSQQEFTKLVMQTLFLLKPVALDQKFDQQMQVMKDQSPQKAPMAGFEEINKPTAEDDMDIIDYTTMPDAEEDRMSFNLLDEFPILSIADNTNQSTDAAALPTVIGNDKDASGQEVRQLLATEQSVSVHSTQSSEPILPTTPLFPDFLSDHPNPPEADNSSSVQSSSTPPAHSPSPDSLPPLSTTSLSTMPNANTTSVAPATSSASAEADHSAGKLFQNWLRIRQGIITDRVDTERARLTRVMSAQDLSAEATRKFWKKCRRKIESESFGESHRCQWKLGVAHEGNFFGRKRIILRPKFDNLHQLQNTISETNLASNEEAEISSDELNRALAKQCSGYIIDVTRMENLDKEESNFEKNNPASSESPDVTPVAGAGVGAADNKGTPIPGTGWGLVDADGSEEGFGVVGLFQDSLFIPEEVSASKKDAPIGSTPSNAVKTNTPEGNKGTNGAPSVPMEPVLLGDMMGDVHLMEENLRNGKMIVETGPCHTGTYRVGSGLAKLEAKVVMVTASGNYWGYLSFNGKEIFFRSSFDQEDVHRHDNAAVNALKEHRMRRRRWLLSTVCGIYLRRYRLRDSAMEVFFRRGKHRNFFVDFGHTRENAKQRNDFAKALMQAAPSTAFKHTPGMTAFRMVYEHGVQEKWLAGKMSNFDYLMALNTLAGRSFNDLCQYPVMPWILTDYKSETLDLNNTSIYRDLSKPMGALNENRLKEFLDRFYSFEENVSSGIPAFMYGSHYSTMVGVVLHFLVRLQPFAALHREMQNGRFDVSDRLFSSIPRSFLHNTTQLSEVKELIPEWFTTPDMFRNVNNFDFGHTQDGENIEDVELPAWAKTPEDFVRIHREALESDYVTEHLHEWIDLIFGYKQRGPDAVAANNVFYYLTYYGAVDHYMIEDETLRRATELQIAHFGQTPMQLFRTPHPVRKVRGTNAVFPITRPLRQNFAMNTKDFKLPRNDEEMIAFHAPATVMMRKSQSVVIQLTILVDRVVCILDNGVVEVFKYNTSEEAKTFLANLASVGNGVDKSSHGRSNHGNSGSKRSRAPSITDPKDKLKNGNGGNGNGGSATSSSKQDADLLLDVSVNVVDPSLAPLQTRRKPSLSNASVDSLASDDNGYSMIVASGNWLREGEVLIYAEKEYIHFDVVPRVPLPRQYRVVDKNSAIPSTESKAPHKDILDSLIKPKPQLFSQMSSYEKLAHLVVFSRTSKLCLAGGRIDGAVVIRELDERTGFIRSAGEFNAHRRRVVSLATDVNLPEYDIVASVDEGGIIYVWTILNTKAKGISPVAGQSIHVVSRRPQRQFRCDPPADLGDRCSSPIQIDISSQMGIVVVISVDTVYIFSIERNELLRRFVLGCFQSSQPTIKSTIMATDADGKPMESSCTGFAFTGPIQNALENRISTSSFTTKEDLLAPKHFPRRLVVSDYGMIVVHVESFIFTESLLEFEEHHLHQQQHMLLAHTVSGIQTAVVQCNSPVSCLVCPDRGEVVISGHHDGSVRFYRCQDLALLYQLLPHSYCTPVSMALPGAKYSSSSSHGTNTTGPRRRGSTEGSTNSMIPPSSIIAIAVGPNRCAPSMLSLSSESGAVYFKAFPDFVRWEKQRQPSALVQLVNSAPLQAVKGTLLQAHNWTQETAGVIAQNARSLADEAVSELKKLQKSNIIKGMASFFGVGSKSEDGNTVPPRPPPKK